MSNREHVVPAKYVVWLEGSPTVYFGRHGLAGTVTSAATCETVVNTLMTNMPTSGGRIHFSGGAYGLSAPMIINKNGVEFEGDSRFSVSFIANTTGTSMISLEIPSGETQLQRIGIRKLRFEGVTNALCAITSEGIPNADQCVRNLTVENCEFNSFDYTGTNTHAINMKNVEASWFLNNRFVFCASNNSMVKFWNNGYMAGNVIFDGNTLQAYCATVTFVQIEPIVSDFTNFTARGNLFETQTTLTPNCVAYHIHAAGGHVVGFKSDGDRIEDFDRAYDFQGSSALGKYVHTCEVSHSRIWSDSFSNATLINISPYTYGIDIHDNWIYAANSLATMTGVYVNSNGEGIKIHDNYFAGFAGTNSAAISWAAYPGELHNNTGFLTATQGFATVATQATVTTVLHGLAVTPKYEWLTPVQSMAGIDYWATYNLAATFSILLSATSATTAFGFHWQAKHL